MKQVIIVNASGFGREVFWILKNSSYFGKEYTIKGFLDNRKDMLAPYSYEQSIISSVENYEPNDNDYFVCAISNPFDKKRYAQMLKCKGGKFMNVIDESSSLKGNISLGEGVIITNKCSISCDVYIGDFVTLNAFSSLGHDVRVNNYAHINSFCSINGGVDIGEFSIVHSHAVVLPSLKVGKGCVVGAGSVVMKDVADNETVFGMPATRVMT